MRVLTTQPFCVRVHTKPKENIHTKKHNKQFVYEVLVYSLRLAGYEYSCFVSVRSCSGCLRMGFGGDG